MVTILVGGQWGDEGKGKIIDLLSEKADMVRRIGFRAGDLLKPRFLEKKLGFVLNKIKNPILQELYHVPPLDPQAVLDEYTAYGERLRPYIRDIFPIVHEALAGNKQILLEGAQGSMLDLDFGTYPYVTSSSPTAGGALTGSGNLRSQGGLT